MIISCLSDNQRVQSHARSRKPHPCQPHLSGPARRLLPSLLGTWLHVHWGGQGAGWQDAGVGYEEEEPGVLLPQSDNALFPRGRTSKTLANAMERTEMIVIALFNT